MIDEFAKRYLHEELRQVRSAMLDKLDGLSEYDVRRPLTPTGTNLLGLIKHLSTWEARYLGEVFDRPFPERLPKWDDAESSDDLWVGDDETRSAVIDRFRRVWDHSAATINALAIDSPGHVAWWPQPDVMLFNVLVHLVAETNRHAGHADILREQIDGKTGFGAEDAHLIRGESSFWADRFAQIEQAAKSASGLLNGDNEWDEYAGTWDEDVAARAYSAAVFSSLQEVLADAGIGLGGANVIDFGCGTGLLTERIVAAGAMVVAVDTSTAMLEVLRAKIANHGWTSVGTGVALPTVGATFDLVVCSSVCAFVDDYPGAVGEMVSRLRPGGLFVQWDWERTGDDSDGLTRGEIRVALTRAGLIDIAVTTGFEVALGDQIMSPLMGHGRRPLINGR